jgi:hypothetical protein
MNGKQHNRAHGMTHLETTSRNNSKAVGGMMCLKRVYMNDLSKSVVDALLHDSLCIINWRYMMCTKYLHHRITFLLCVFDSI